MSQANRIICNGISQLKLRLTDISHDQNSTQLLALTQAKSRTRTLIEQFLNLINLISYYISILHLAGTRDYSNGARRCIATMAGTSMTLMAGNNDEVHQSPTSSQSLQHEEPSKISGSLKVIPGRYHERTLTPALEAVTLGHNTSRTSPSRSSSTTVVDQESPSGSDSPYLQVQNFTKLPPWRKWSIFACSCLLQFLLNLDMASVAVTLPVYDIPRRSLTLGILSTSRPCNETK